MSTKTIMLMLVLLGVILHTTNAYRMVCYYTNWAQYRSGRAKYIPSNVDPKLCTHGIFSFAKLTGNRLDAVEWNDKDTDWSKGMYTKFNNIKTSNPGFKTLIAVGGWNMGSAPFTAMVATESSRKEFCDSTVDFLRKWNFDGLDLDWEYPANRGSPSYDKQRFSQLIKKCKETFQAESRRTGKTELLLTAAVAAGYSKVPTAYEIRTIAQYLDFINLMAYDLHGSYETTTGHHSQLYVGNWETGNDRKLNVDHAINLWLSGGTPANKLVMGIPTYGQSFRLTSSNSRVKAPSSGGAPAGTYTKQAGFMSYYEICDLIKSGGVKHRLNGLKAPYVVKGTTWVGFDDEESIGEKTSYIRSKRLGGGMIWALDLDDFNGQSCGKGNYPLLTAIVNGMNGKLTPNTYTTRSATTTRRATTTTRRATTTTAYSGNVSTFCQNKADGLYSYPGQCPVKKFIQCWRRYTYVKSCGNLYYNKLYKYCDYLSNVKC